MPGLSHGPFSPTQQLLFLMVPPTKPNTEQLKFESKVSQIEKRLRYLLPHAEFQVVPYIAKYG